MGMLTELVTKFSFKGSLTPLKNFNSGLSHSIKSLTIFTATIAGIGTAISALVLGTAEATEAQINLSKQTGISVEKIRELTYIGGQFGITANTVNSSISELSKKIGEAATMGSEDFERLGISIRDSAGNVKNVSQVITELRHSFQQLNLSKQQQVSFAQNLGLDANFVQVLNLSDKRFQQLTKTVRSFGVVTAEQAESLESINQNLATMHFGFKALKTQIAVALAPTFKNLTDMFTDFISKHSSQISGFFTELGFLTVSLARDLKFLMPVILPLVGGFLLLNKTAQVFKAGILGAIVLGVDDLIVAFKGGKSAIRAWVKELTGIDITPFLQNTVKRTETAVKALNHFFHINKKHLTHTQQVYKAFFAAFEPYSVTGALKGETTVNHQINAAKQNKPNVNVTNHIHVKSTDPKQAAKEIKDTFNNQLRYMQSSFAIGGL